MSASFPLPPPPSLGALMLSPWIVLAALLLSLRYWERLSKWKYLQIFLRIPWLRCRWPSPQFVLKLSIAIVASVAVFTSYLYFSHYFISITVSEGELAVDVAPYFIHKEIRSGDIARAFVANYSSLGELRPVLRTFGTGLPGYCVGWFKLANGASALLLVGSERILILELKDGMYVFLAPPGFDEFLEAFERDVMPVGGPP